MSKSLPKNIKALKTTIIKDKDYMKLRYTRTNAKLYKDRLNFLNQMEEYISDWYRQRLQS